MNNSSGNRLKTALEKHLLIGVAVLAIIVGCIAGVIVVKSSSSSVDQHIRQDIAAKKAHNDRVIAQTPSPGSAGNVVPVIRNTGSVNVPGQRVVRPMPAYLNPNGVVPPTPFTPANISPGGQPPQR